MDGLKNRMKDSIQIRLSVWLSLVVLAVAVIAGIVAFLAAFDEAHELQDDVLGQVATLFDRDHLPIPEGTLDGPLSERDRDARLRVRLLAPRTPGAGAASPTALPASLHEGIQTAVIGHKTYRVYVKQMGSGERIAVAQETAARNEIARDSALSSLIPLLILVPILVAVVTALVRKIFRPIARLSAEVDRRGEHELHPLVADPLPTEVRPFALAINRLLRRIARSMQAQQRFVADAAHELRSPLTAMSLQAERLADAEMSDTARERLSTLRHGIERGRALLDQLLTLARAQTASARPVTLVEVQTVYRRVLEDLIPLAQAKGIDIGVLGDAAFQVPADEIDLVTVVRNLVDNAIRYTPAGGRVDLAVTGTPDAILLEVEDNGPGIGEAERERVLDPFYRVLGSVAIGSGLGLSIVKTITERLGGTIRLGDALRSPHGLRVSVRLPTTRDRH